MSVGSQMFTRFEDFWQDPIKQICTGYYMISDLANSFEFSRGQILLSSRMYICS